MEYLHSKSLVHFDLKVRRSCPAVWLVQVRCCLTRRVIAHHEAALLAC